MKDLVFSTLGATNHSDTDRENNDYYATDPQIVRLFLNQTDIQKYLSPNILEPCCGIGHISKVLEDYGYNVISSDLIDRGFGDGGG